MDTDRRTLGQLLMLCVVTAFTSEALGQGAVLRESFSRASADLPADYPYLTLVLTPGASASASGGILRLAGGHPDSGLVYASAANVLGTETFGDHVVAETNMGADDVVPSWTGVALVVGNIMGIMHPGYSGGGFRFQTLSGTHLCSNQNMGFTPLPGVLYDFSIEATKLGSAYEFTVTVAGGTYTYTQTIAQSYVQELDKVGVQHGHEGCGLFGYLSVTALDSPCTGPRVLLSPASQTVPAGSAMAVFSVAASGTSPLSYRWRKDGFDLTDDGRIGGATAAALTINAVQSSDAGQYDVVVANECGEATSDAATLTVLTAQPPRVHALLVGCEAFRNWYFPPSTWTYHGMKDAVALGAALYTLANVERVEYLEITPGTTTAQTNVLAALRRYTDPKSPEFVPAGESFLLFIGAHGENGRLALQINPDTGNSVPGEGRLTQVQLRDALASCDATKVVILPGCHTESLWPSPGLEDVSNTCLFAGAGAADVAHVLPDPFLPGLPAPWYLSTNPAGMTPLTVTLVIGLMRTPWTTSPADTNFDGVVSFAELRWWMRAANTFPLFYLEGFGGWSTFDNSNWPILDGLGDLEPFSYAPAVMAPDGFDDAPLAGSTGTPGDFDSDGDVDLADFAAFQACAGDVADRSACFKGDFDTGSTVDAADLNAFNECLAGPDAPSACLPPGCGTPVQDTDRNGRVNTSDFANLTACFSGPVWPWPDGIAQQLCMCLDQDSDLDVDLADFAAFQVAFTGD